jgi:hypothetical protein
VKFLISHPFRKEREMEHPVHAARSDTGVEVPAGVSTELLPVN